MSVPKRARPIFMTWRSSVPPAYQAASPSASAKAAMASLDASRTGQREAGDHRLAAAAILGAPTRTQ